VTVAATIALLAALPAAPAAADAQAATVAAALTLPPGGIGQLSAPNLDELVGEGELGADGVPLSALEAPLLAKLLSKLPGINALATVNGLGGAPGVEAAMLQAIEQLVGEGELVEELVGGFGLAFDFEEQLEATYEASQAAHEPGAPETLEEAVEEALVGRSPEEVIDEGLESLPLGELLSKAIAKAVHPTVLVQALFAACEQEELQEILGTELAGEPFVGATAAEAAAAIGITAAELAEKLGKTPAQLPGGSLALFAALHNGQQLGVFAAKQGLAFGLVGEAPPPEEEPEETEGAEEEGQEGSSGVGMTGNPGGSNPPAGSLVTNTPATTASVTPANPPATPAATATVTASAAAKVRIVAHKVTGAAVTLIVQVAGSGRLTVGGHGLATVRRSIAHARRVTVRLRITRAAAAALQRHHRLRLSPRASFAPGSGAPSVATTTVTLR
jgi:hypothetical protein